MHVPILVNLHFACDNISPQTPHLCILETEARFHYVVKRDPLRENSAAWTRAQSSSVSVPSEMKNWVDAEVKAEATVQA